MDTLLLIIILVAIVILYITMVEPSLSKFSNVNELKIDIDPQCYSILKRGITNNPLYFQCNDQLQRMKQVKCLAIERDIELLPYLTPECREKIRQCEELCDKQYYNNEYLDHKCRDEKCCPSMLGCNVDEDNEKPNIPENVIQDIYGDYLMKPSGDEDIL